VWPGWSTSEPAGGTAHPLTETWFVVPLQMDSLSANVGLEVVLRVLLTIRGGQRFRRNSTGRGWSGWRSWATRFGKACIEVEVAVLRVICLARLRSLAPWPYQSLGPSRHACRWRRTQSVGRLVAFPALALVAPTQVLYVPPVS